MAPGNADAGHLCHACFSGSHTERSNWGAEKHRHAHRYNRPLSHEWDECVPGVTVDALDLLVTGSGYHNQHAGKPGLQLDLLPVQTKLWGQVERRDRSSGEPIAASKVAVTAAARDQENGRCPPLCFADNGCLCFSNYRRSSWLDRRDPPAGSDHLFQHAFVSIRINGCIP